MNKKDYAFKYSDYVRRIVTLAVLPFINLVIACLTYEENEPFGVWVIILGFCLSTVLILLLHFLRKVALGTLLGVDLEFRYVYELDKRKNNDRLNLIREQSMYFFEGDFEKSDECCEKLLSLNLKKQEEYLVKSQLIYSRFFIDDSDSSVIELISDQRVLASKYKIAEHNRNDCYFSFIERYLTVDYERAVMSIENLLNDNNIKLVNSRVVVVCYMLIKAYEKIGDREKIEHYSKKLLSADPNRKTVFGESIKL